ncbi:MAG: YgiT-type zinc finger protein [Candidatus Micrarchaeota archaeon]|nr:YgiT-type zinc finger protein [Candidatus Micrarchaeota archaeon]
MLCPKCRKGRMHETRVSKLYGDKVLVENVRVLKCTPCGAEVLGESEYERVRGMVQKIQQKTPQKVLAAIRYLVI